jgi:membrane protein implicated in regulation of membrane protease activity
METALVTGWLYPYWTTKNAYNSGLPSDYVYAVAIDGAGDKWIGTYGGGLAKFDGTGWTVYNMSNSGLPSDHVVALAIDGAGNKWIGTFSAGLTRFDGTSWTVYTASNSGLPSDNVKVIVIDGDGNKWIGTERGLTKFDGTSWTVYNSSNSGLPYDGVTAIAIDRDGNKWIGTSAGGLAAFQEGGVILGVEERFNTVRPVLDLKQNYPNPFNPSTTIGFTLPRASRVVLKIYNTLGQQVTEVLNAEMAAGMHSILWSPGSIPSGVYFYRLQAANDVKTKSMVLMR